MNGKLKGLRKQALFSCNWRGHDMRRFTRYDDHTYYSHCKNCDMQVVIISAPQPNEIDIGGEAVALNCPN